MPAEDTPPSRGLAILRGLAGRCPCCGQGRLFPRYLKTVEICPSCGEALGRIPADDAPPYLTVLVLGFILVPGILITVRLDPPTAVAVGIWLPLSVALVLALLPRCKGAIIGLIWSLER